MICQPKFHSEIKLLMGKLFSMEDPSELGEPFVSDLNRFHPRLLQDSLKEAIHSPHKMPTNNETRDFVLSIYSRKTKEMAALYPLLFATESALRSNLSSKLFKYFKKDVWWMPVYNALKQGYSIKESGQLSGKRVNSKFVDTLEIIIKKTDGDNLVKNTIPSLTCTSDFLEKATFGSLRYMILYSMSFVEVFENKNVKEMKYEEFNMLSHRILNARNEIYHHNPISERQKLVQACERISDCIDINLCHLDGILKGLNYKRPFFSVKTSDRHGVFNLSAPGPSSQATLAF